MFEAVWLFKVLARYLPILSLENPLIRLALLTRELLLSFSFEELAKGLLDL
jgi:hypothetical protein